MKNLPFALTLLLLGVLLPAGCAYVEVAPVGDGNRVLSGTINYLPATPVPEGAILSVRVVDASRPSRGPVLLGEQRIAISGTPPFEFQAEYRAEDDLLRRGVNVEAKILVNSRLRFANLTSYAVTLARATDKHEITVLPAGR